MQSLSESVRALLGARAALLAARGAADAFAASVALGEIARQVGLLLADALQEGDVRIAFGGTSAQDPALAPEARPTEPQTADADDPGPETPNDPSPDAGPEAPSGGVRTEQAPAEPTPRRPATAADLARLATFGRAGPTPTEVTPAFQPVLPVFSDTIDHQLERVERAVAERRRWTSLPRDLQAALLGATAAWLRHIQEAATDADRERVAPLFHSLTAWSKAERPGFVHGLSRDHTPQHGTWASDAAWYSRPFGTDDVGDPLDSLEQGLMGGQTADELRRRIRAAVAAHRSAPAKMHRLARLLAGRVDLLVGPEFKAVRKRLAETPDAVAVAKPSPIPDDHPVLATTRDLRVLVVGGDRRSDAEQRWRDAFRFAAVDWNTGDKVRRGQADADGVARYDLVVVLVRFLGHSSFQRFGEACKRHGVRMVTLTTGYGVTQLKLAIEGMDRPPQP